MAGVNWVMTPLSSRVSASALTRMLGTIGGEMTSISIGEDEQSRFPFNQPGVARTSAHAAGRGPDVSSTAI